jgi:release factor glutamine methyltransferase
MTKSIAEAMAIGRRSLQSAGISSFQLDARLLLQAALGITHETIIADPDTVVDAAALLKYHAFIARREMSEPVSRILMVREFYGRNFFVTPEVLDPRADTETLIELALPFLHQLSAPRILDLGAGSGAIIVTLLAECPQSTGVAADLSRDALTVVQQNAIVNDVAERLHVVASDWFTDVIGQFDLIISNPPYIPAAEILTLERDVKDFDPVLALDGGVDGLDPYHRIAADAASHLTQGGNVIVEFGAGQGADVGQIFARYGFVEIARGIDLGGHLRGVAYTYSGV